MTPVAHSRGRGQCVGATTCLSAAQRALIVRALVWLGAPNAGNFPRVWRVWSGVSLQTWVIFPAFVVAQLSDAYVPRSAIMELCCCIFI
ncbi:hypothetical protein BFS15_04220 [Gardnerella sp. DNF01162]|nr:hypothetical protein BFS15_04220 [Gardnerella sp. DNF01162]RFD73387.1 hypothetical protein AXE72_05140 [Gardnerella vaginalis]